ncbi:response regulator [Thermodesulfobacteriota bacterium]
MNHGISKVVREHLGFKIILALTLLIFLISISFTAHFARKQSASMRDDLLTKGALLAQVLAHSCRIGVFSENVEVLQDALAGVFHQSDVLGVSVYNATGGLLTERWRGSKAVRRDPKGPKMPPSAESLASSEKDRDSFFREDEDILAFFAPVRVRPDYTSEESLYFEEHTRPGVERVIGLVTVTMSKMALETRFNSLLVESILIGSLFLLAGLGITFFIVRGITMPLRRLTGYVRQLETEGDVEKIPVETRDEIGKLADAFNSMYDSLKSREAERDELEEKLRQSHKMEAIGTLAGGVAHDFNNILTAIIGYASLLQMHLDPGDKSMSYVEQVLHSAERASNLTKNLLAFSRKQIVEPRPVELNARIKNVSNLLSRLIGEDIRLQLELFTEELVVMADPGQIDQILINLATNARDAMPDGGVLKILTRPARAEDGKTIPPGRCALMSFVDTGIGIDTKTMERVFDPFFTTKDVGRGTGLGLSMIYGIVKQYGGHIDISSAPGKGSRFDIFIPLTEAAPDAMRTENLHGERRGTETVLIAEDDRTVREFARDVLTEYGYQVIEAGDGEEAVRKFEEHARDIDLVLIDVVMPKKNGKSAYDEIKRMKHDVKAVFVSGYTSDIVEAKGVVEEGATFIAKPFGPERLLSKVREVLKH